MNLTIMTNSHNNRLDTLSLRVLRVLFELAQHGHEIHVGALAHQLEVGRTLVASALARLDQAGLVRAERVRLTMAGLVIAQRLAPVALRVTTRVREQSAPVGRISVRAPDARPSALSSSWMRATGS